MAINSVSDFLIFINNQIERQEQIEKCLWQLEALTSMAIMAEGFYEQPEKILRNYFSIADLLVEQAVNANQKAIGELYKLIADEKI